MLYVTKKTIDTFELSAFVTRLFIREEGYDKQFGEYLDEANSPSPYPAKHAYASPRGAEGFYFFLNCLTFLSNFKR
jgi:hypothetical protein